MNPTDTAGCDVSLIIACYNEEPLLVQSVEEVLNILDSTRWSYEVIFVDDASRDGTRGLIDDIIARHPEHRMSRIFHEKNTGRGRTVSDGFRAARGDIVGYIDIDLEVHARYIPSCIIAIRKGADVAIAQRNYKLQPRLLERHILSRGYSWLVRAALDLPPQDTESGYKFFRRDKLMALLDQVEDPGWFWDTEVMARCDRAGYAVAEVPALFIRRYDKKSTVHVFRDSLAYFMKLFRFRKALRAIEPHPSVLERRRRARVPLIYRHPRLYELLMRVLYGRHFADRYGAVAGEIEDGSDVVDVCAGDARLYLRHLRGRPVKYTALDLSPHMVRWAARHGVDARVFDALSDDIPACDVAVMQGSLYQFLPDARPVLEKMLSVARRKVVVAEPVANLSSSAHPWLARLSRRLTDPGGRAAYTGERFDREGLEAFFSSFPEFDRLFPINGGRECVGVFRGRGT